MVFGVCSSRTRRNVTFKVVVVVLLPFLQSSWGKILVAYLASHWLPVTVIQPTRRAAVASKSILGVLVVSFVP